MLLVAVDYRRLNEGRMDAARRIPGLFLLEAASERSRGPFFFLMRK